MQIVVQAAQIIVIQAAQIALVLTAVIAAKKAVPILAVLVPEARIAKTALIAKILLKQNHQQNWWLCLNRYFIWNVVFILHLNLGKQQLGKFRLRTV